MQTASSKTLLAEFGGSTHRLAVGHSLEKVVSHEIKELGQHVLGCIVSYRMPPGMRAPPGQPTDTQDPSIQSFRKFYKFAVTNPLSVKTKVHLPRSPSALLSTQEREKVFLEVHIQNLTQDAMWLERMQFECVDGWQVQDTNSLENPASGSKEPLFSGSTALMQPQDVRQYIYILLPVSLPPFPITHAPGAILGLGRLDISWRSSYGEPGRLLTSTLSRRIPLIQAPSNSQTPPPGVKQPPSAIPLHLQRSNTISGSPSRCASSLPTKLSFPQPPTKCRTSASQSITVPWHAPVLHTPVQRPPEDIELDLVVTSIPRDSLELYKPFNIALKVTALAPVPLPRLNEPRKQRVVSLVVQHTQPPKEMTVAAAVASAVATAAGPPNPQGGWTPRMPSSGFSTPSPYGTPSRADFPDTLTQKLLVASPRHVNGSDVESDGGDTPGADPTAPRADDVTFLGTSTLFLPALRLLIASLSTPAAQPRASGHTRDVSDSSVDSESDNEPLVAPERLKVTASQEFELSYVPRRSGFLAVGGLRVLVVEDRLVDEDDSADGPVPVIPVMEPRVLKEWEVIGEVWVKS
uniref:N/A n=1 Tax=Ganoderma boninense TaxID=34458 RepID=A0A5K1K094_9APHY|nr:N/A [Ganoderma boninense]